MCVLAKEITGLTAENLLDRQLSPELRLATSQPLWRDTMDPAVISATSALFGSLVGAISSFATTWLTQSNQVRAQWRISMAGKREALYGEFIREASRRLADALGHQADSPDVIVLLYASIGQMRLVSSREVIKAAEDVARLVMDAYAAPNQSFMDFRESVAAQSLDPLSIFGDACRLELSAIKD